MNNTKISKDFAGMTKDIEKMIDKYNKSFDSLKSQELAIEKVKNQLEEAKVKAETMQRVWDKGPKNSFKDVVALDNQNQKVSELTSKLDILNSKFSQSKESANGLANEIENAFKEKGASAQLGNKVEEVGKKIDTMRTKISRMIGTAMVFSLLQSQLTNLRSGLINILKSNNQFSSSLNQIKANLMTAFAPIYNACLPAINSLMNAISKITGTIAVFISSLFGKSLKEAKNEAKGLSKALDKTAKSGDDASGSLASFDHLEVIGNDSGNTQGISGNSGSGINYDNEIQYSQKLLEFLNRIKDFIIENKKMIIGALLGVAGAIVAIKLGCEGIQALGIGLVITGIVMLIQDVIKFLKDPSWEGFGQILIDIGIILLGLVAIFGGLPLAIGAIIAIIVGLVIKNWEQIKGIFSKAGEWFYTYVIQPILTFFSGLWEGISLAASTCLNLIKDIWTLLSEWINNFVIQPILSFFIGLWNSLLSGAKGAWNGIKNVFSTVATFFKNVFTNAWTAVKNVFSTGGKIFDGIKEGILQSFTNIVNAIIRGINKIVAVPFNGINTALSKIKNIEIVGLKPFNWIKTISVPKLPMLAKGTVIPPRHEFAAILGDQKHGTNIEAPLETIKQANREVLSEFFNQFKNLSNDIKEIVFKNFTIVAQFGNRDFQRLVIDAIRLTEKELGRPLFVS